MDNLKYRTFQKELMDMADLDTRKIESTYRNLGKVNIFLSGIRHSLLKTVIRDMLCSKSMKFTILDIGCGGGENTRWLIQKCIKSGLECTAVCIDNNPYALKYAKKLCKNYPQISFVQFDAIEALDSMSFDYIFANYFLHHIHSDFISTVIKKIAISSKKGFLINDLKRSNFFLFLFGCIAPFLIRDSYTQIDGMRSIKNGFRIRELVDACKGLENLGKLEIKGAAPGHLSIWFKKS